MTDADMIEVEERKGHLRVTLPGKLNMDNIVKIRNRIEMLLTKEHTRLVLDLSNIKAAGSIVINLIMDIRQIITSLKGTLWLVNLNEECYKTFKLINLDKVLKIFKREDDLNY